MAGHGDKLRLPWLSVTTERPSHDYSRSGWRIPQLDAWDVYKDPSMENPEAVRFRTERLIQVLKSKHKTSPVIRPLSNSLYNCVGLIFCSRRAHVDIAYIDEILKQDGYNEITKDECVAGDLVLYTFEGEPSHIGLVSCVSWFQDRVARLTVLSKWGKAGEVEHDHDHVPVHCGIPTAYYSTRINHVTQ